MRYIIGPYQIQKSLNTVDEWSKGNDMSVNTNKTKHLPINFTLQPYASV